MTIQRMRFPLGFALSLLLYAWVMTLLPLTLQNAARAANFVCIIALLIWHNQRVDRKLREIIGIVNASEESRSRAVKALETRAEEIAAALKKETERRQHVEVTALEAQTKHIVQTIEEGTRQVVASVTEQKPGATA